MSFDCKDTSSPHTSYLIAGLTFAGLFGVIFLLSMNNVVFGFPGAGGGIAGNKLRGGFLKIVFLEKPRAGTEHINQLVKECFESAHFKISWVKDMQNWLWNHFAMNAAMETEVLKRGSFPALMNHKDSFSNVGLSMREMIPVLKARGAKLDAISLLLTKIPPALLGTLFTKVIFAKGSLPRLFVEYNNSKAGFAVLEVVREAKKVGIPIPRLTTAFENTEHHKAIENPLLP